jgi:hypothetical protein
MTPGRAGRARALLHFVIAGALLFAARTWWVRLIPPAAAGVAVSDDDLLLEEGLRLGLAAADPVIVHRLAENLRFAGEASGSDAALAARAVRLGMHRIDALVRRRLIQHAERALERRSRAREPGPGELAEHLARHPGRFAVPGHVQVSQVLVARRPQGAAVARSDAELEARATALAARLHDSNVPPGEAHRLGDPLGLWPATQVASAAQLDAQLGSGLGAAIAERAPVGRWHEPLSSSFGLHLVFVHRRIPGRTPALAEVRGRVRESLLHDRARRDRRAALAALRLGPGVDAGGTR